jgi:hypothetical protein
LKKIIVILLCWLPGSFSHAYARTKAGRVYGRAAPDSPLCEMFHTHIVKLKAIPLKHNTDDYYVRLMLALYHGASDMVRTHKNKNSGDKAAVNCISLEQYHRRMKGRFLNYMALSSKGKTVDRQFKSMADAALQHFSQFNCRSFKGSKRSLELVLIEFYENMDQISVAFVSKGSNVKIKQLAWESIKKQNQLIDILKQNIGE